MSYANQTLTASVAGATAYAPTPISKEEPNRTETLLNIASSLIDMAGGLASRIENLDARMFGGPPQLTGADSKTPAQPVRPAMDELHHRLECAHKLLQRGFDAINRLDRL